MKKELKSINDMVDRISLELWKRKAGLSLTKEYFDNFPIKIFNVTKIFEGIPNKENLSKESLDKATAILSDLKVLFYFLSNVTNYFYVGTATVVGNYNYNKVNLNTLSFLQGNHYKTFLITIIYERILDFLELINFNELKDHKKKKWEKKYLKLCTVPGFEIIPKDDHDKMIDFKEHIRRAEIHGFSKVIRQLKANNWNHFQQEENLIREILLRISAKYN